MRRGSWNHVGRGNWSRIWHWRRGGVRAVGVAIGYAMVLRGAVADMVAALGGVVYGGLGLVIAVLVAVVAALGGGHLCTLAAGVVGGGAALSVGVEGDEGEGCRDGCCYKDIGFHGLCYLGLSYMLPEPPLDFF